MSSEMRVTDAMVEAAEIGALRETRPQNASGDAERLEMLRQVYGMACEGCESPMAAYRWCERIDELFHAGKPSDEYADYARDLPDAMQAKEAK